MKISRIFCFMLLAIAFLPGSAQWAHGQDMFIVVGGSRLLNRSSQICNLTYNNSTKDWDQILPDGNTQTFTWGNGKSFVMTEVAVSFYADTIGSFPYRLCLKAPNGGTLWISYLDNITYPGSSTIWGGGHADTINPGVVISVKPSIEVRQVPVPPNDPSTGPVQTGTLYIRIIGYIVP